MQAKNMLCETGPSGCKSWLCHLLTSHSALLKVPKITIPQFPLQGIRKNKSTFLRDVGRVNEEEELNKCQRWWSPWFSGSQLGEISTPRRHPGMLGDVLDRQYCKWGCRWHLVGRGQQSHQTSSESRTALHHHHHQRITRNNYQQCPGCDARNVSYVSSIRLGKKTLLKKWANTGTTSILNFVCLILNIAGSMASL